MNGARIVSIVLNWNNYLDSRDCIESLKSISYENHDIVVVDNGSEDDSLENLRDDFPDVEFVPLDQNRGFSGGMNAGISWALERDADYVWILNNDVVVKDNQILNELLHYFDDPSVGGVTPQILEYPDTDSAWFTMGEVDRRSGHSIHHQSVSEEFGEPIENDYIPLCSALFSTKVFEEYGYLPDKYFIYREDVAFSYQLGDDYRLLTAPECTVYHKSSSSGGGDLNQTLSYYTARNRWLLFHEYSDDMSFPRFLWQYFKWGVSRSGMMVKRAKIGSLSAFARGTVDGILNKVGKGRYP